MAKIKVAVNNLLPGNFSSQLINRFLIREFFCFELRHINASDFGSKEKRRATDPFNKKVNTIK